MIKEHRDVIRRAEELRRARSADAAADARWAVRQGVLDLPVAEPTCLPFPVDPTHDVIVCGGYAGCRRCGSVCAYHQNGTLAGTSR